MREKTKEESSSDKKKLALALVAFIVLMIIFVPLKEKLEAQIGFKEKEIKLLATMDLKWNEDRKVKPYEERVIEAGINSISAYSYDGVMLWKTDLKNNSTTYLSETGFFINNKTNNSITKLDLKGDEIWSYEVNYPAYTMTEIEGYLVVYLKVDKDIRGVTVIDQKGKLVLSKEKSREEILSSNISKDKKQIIITSMDKATQDLNSKITYLKNNGDIVWTEEVKGKIIYNTLFLEKGKILLIGDQEIICKNDLGEDLWKREINNDLKDIEVVDQDKIYMLYGNNESVLEVINSDGEQDYKMNFKKEYQSIDQAGEDTLLIGDREILGLRNKKTTIKHQIKGQVKDIKRVDDYIVISRDEKVEIFKITDKKNKKTK